MSKKCKGRKPIGRMLLEQKLAQNNVQFAIIAKGMADKMARKDEMRGVAIEKARQEADLTPCPPVCPPICLDVDVVDVDVVDVNPI